MSAKKPVTGQSKFRPRARLIGAIGEDLISNRTIALVELIKNAYDADASTVTVTFEPPLEAGKGGIIVDDDGHGMTLAVVTGAWMEPASPSKTTVTKTQKGRRITGEKGLGRFAAARLAGSLILESVSAEFSRRVEANFDWDEFKDEERYLDEILCTWSEAELASGTRPGTTLRLQGLREAWDRDAIVSLRTELARLVARPAETAPFKVLLKLPEEFQDLEGEVSPPLILERPHYGILGSVGVEGALDAVVSVEGVDQAAEGAILTRAGSKPRCGPFDFEIRVWDRDRLRGIASEIGSGVRSLAKDLNDSCGISVYRDGFRVMPYGGPGDDWLRLDLRRVNNPTLRLSNNQVVGSIYLTADKNPDLRDQTNREGMVESGALSDLREITKELLGRVEAARFEARRSVREPDDEPSLFGDLDLHDIRDSFREKYPKDREFLAFIDSRVSHLKQTVTRVQEVVARYRRLATLGQIIDTVLHDGRTPVASIANEAKLAGRDMMKAEDLTGLRESLTPRFDVIGQQTQFLSQLFKTIEPFGGRTRGRPRAISIESVVASVFAVQRAEIERLGIRIVLPKGETTVTADENEMQQIFLNLLNNSLYWLEKTDKESRAIAVSVLRSEDVVSIEFSDSGPGVTPGQEEVIFSPYFSTKPEGVGLGLVIAGEVAAAYGGRIELLDHGSLPGATFRVSLRRRLGTK